MVGERSNAGRKKTRVIRTDDIYLIDFLKQHAHVTENGARYWIRKLNIALRHVTHPSTNKTRTVMTQKSARAILRAIHITHHKVDVVNGSQKIAAIAA